MIAFKEKWIEKAASNLLGLEIEVVGTQGLRLLQDCLSKGRIEIDSESGDRDSATESSLKTINRKGP